MLTHHIAFDKLRKCESVGGRARAAEWLVNGVVQTQFARHKDRSKLHNAKLKIIFGTHITK